MKGVYRFGQPNLEKMVRRVKFLSLILTMVSVTLCILLIGCIRKRRAFPSSILYSVTRDQVFQGKSIEDFFAAVTEDRFKSFYNAENLLVEVRAFRSVLSRDRHLTYDASIYIATVCLKRRYYPALLWEVFKAIRHCNFELVPNIRDVKMILIDLPVYKVFERKTNVCIDMITTNSSLARLPSAFMVPLRGKRIMLWYSTNSKPFKYKGKEVKLQWNPTYVRNSVDLHLVWTKFDVDFLESLGITNAHAIGSILMQPRLMAERDNQKFIITYFDVTPVTPSMEWKFGGPANFYSQKNALKDLNQFAEVSSHLTGLFGTKVEFRIKPKRAYGATHSKKYQANVVQLSKDIGIKILNPYANLYSIVSQSDTVIATPWTSPAVLAKELRTDAIYFGNRGQEWNLPSKHEDIEVMGSTRELTEYLLRRIKIKFANQE